VYSWAVKVIGGMPRSIVSFLPPSASPERQHWTAARKNTRSHSRSRRHRPRRLDLLRHLPCDDAPQHPLERRYRPCLTIHEGLGHGLRIHHSDRQLGHPLELPAQGLQERPSPAVRPPGPRGTSRASARASGRQVVARERGQPCEPPTRSTRARAKHGFSPSHLSAQMDAQMPHKWRQNAKVSCTRTQSL